MKKLLFVLLLISTSICMAQKVDLTTQVQGVLPSANVQNPLNQNTTGTAANATAVGGVTVTGTPTAGQTPIATSNTAATWQTPSGGPTAGQGFAVSGGVGSTTGVTTSQIPFNNSNSLTPSMQIAVVPTTFAYTVPTNGVISGSTTTRNATSEMYLVSLPAATWIATLYRYPAATAGCLTSSPTSIGTVSVATNGAQTWTVTQTSFAIGDCLVLVAPSVVDNNAANPYGAIAVVD